jgi:Uma2 family endonuclease
MGATTKLLSVEEYLNIPDPPGARYELHHGELVEVPFPKFRHAHVQRRIQKLVEPYAAGFEILVECAFRPMPQHEMWGADVAAISLARYRQTDLDGYIEGSPELVIEVLSPSNTVSEMQDKQDTCFRGGCLEFWTVDTKRQTVCIVTSKGTTSIYGPGQRVPLALFGGAEIAVDDIFAI